MTESTGERRGRRRDASEWCVTDGGSETSAEVGPVRAGWERPGRLPLVVVESVAAATGRAPTALPPMYPTVDPDALERLFRSASSGSGLRVTFGYAGCTVAVGSDGEVVVEPGE